MQLLVYLLFLLANAQLRLWPFGGDKATTTETSLALPGASSAVLSSPAQSSPSSSVQPSSSLQPSPSPPPPSSSAVPSPSASPSPSISTSPTPSVRPSPSPTVIDQEKNSDQQSGPTAGIVLGVIAGVVLLAIIGIWIFRKYGTSPSDNFKSRLNEMGGAPRLDPVSVAAPAAIPQYTSYKVNNEPMITAYERPNFGYGEGFYSRDNRYENQAGYYDQPVANPEIYNQYDPNIYHHYDNNAQYIEQEDVSLNGQESYISYGGAASPVLNNAMNKK